MWYGIGRTHRQKRLSCFAVLGDGELEEGQVWEAAMFAGFYKLNNLTAFIDFNGLQIDGDIREVMSPLPIAPKFEAFNWNVIEVNGHDLMNYTMPLKPLKLVPTNRQQS